MRLQTKLILSFSLVAVITLAVAATGYWQARKLATALYEVGAVRLPSIQGLDAIDDGLATARAVEQALLLPNLDAAAVNRHLDRERAARRQVDKGWALYAPLPQTPTEAVKWKAFVPAWQAWDHAHQSAMNLAVAAQQQNDPARLAQARAESEQAERLAAEVAQLLDQLSTINDEVAARAKENSVNSQQDMVTIERLMLAIAALGVACAIGLGIWLGRRISRPVEKMAEGFAAVARGDLKVHIPAHSNDEIGQAAHTMNVMVESLRDARNTIQVISDSLPNCMIYRMVRDPGRSRRFTYVSAGVERLHGLTAEAVLRDPSLLFDRVLPEDRAALATAQAASETSQQVFAVAVRVRMADGTVRWRQLYSQPRRLDDGRMQWDGIELDITDRKEAEQALWTAAERLKLAVQASRLGVFEVDGASGRITWDARLFEIFGFDPQGPTPTWAQLIELAVPEEQAAFVAAREKMLAEENAYDLQVRIQRPDGIRVVRTQCTVRRDSDGRIVHTVGVVSDLTELVRANEEAGRLREKLRQSQKMETLGTLAAGIAHDFNNLLTGINGFVELGASSLPPDHEAIGMLQQARQGTMSARDLVRRILDFSRRVPEAERSAVSLAAFVRNTAPLITAGLPDQITLSITLHPAAPRVLADPSQLQQILMNLCVNGAQAIGTRSGTVTIGLEHRMIGTDETGRDGTPVPPGEYACLTVADTGCGMNAEVRARIFEPFYTTKQPGEGTGLGLSVVQDIVVDHGGFIRVQSEPGRGTLFEILLPACPEPTAPAPAVPVGAPSCGKGERILVVDDEPAITSLVMRALTSAGYRPEVFTSAMEAWTHFATGPDRFDLLLTDHRMPEVTGTELASRVRRASLTLPVLIMTARVHDIDPVVLQTLGGVRVLPKPFAVQELLVEVADSLRPMAPPAKRQPSLP